MDTSPHRRPNTCYYCNKPLLDCIHTSIHLHNKDHKCAPHQKYHSVEPSGNDLLTCGNLTRPASLVTNTSPHAQQARYSTP